MIIGTVQGDLIQHMLERCIITVEDYPERVMSAMAHGCNCFNNMGAGIAAGVAKELPWAYDVDKKTVKGDPSKLGSFSVATSPDGEFAVYNLYTQFKHWGQGPNVDYNAVRKAFKAMNDDFLTAYLQADVDGKHDARSAPKELIGIPKIGAGLAGGDWERIYDIIDDATPDVDVILFEFTPGRRGF